MPFEINMPVDTTNGVCSIRVNNDSGPVSGLDVNVGLRSGLDAEQKLDWDDDTFYDTVPTDSRTTPTQDLDDMGVGLYVLTGGIDFDAITNIDPAEDVIFAEFAITGSVTANPDGIYRLLPAGSTPGFGMAADALTTLAVLKSYLDIPVGETTYDALLTDIINAASLEMQAYTRRQLMPLLIVDEYHDGHNRRRMQLTKYPARSVVITRDSDSTVVDAATYRVDGGSGQALKKSGGWTGGWDAWRVSYSGGLATIPKDLDQACVWECMNRWRKSAPGGAASVPKVGISSFTDPTGFSQTFLPSGLLPEVIQALGPYMKDQMSDG